MPTIETVKKYYPQAACVLGGVLFAVLVPLLGKRPQPQESPPSGPEGPKAAANPGAPPAQAAAQLSRGLDANLYMQVSAEYRACCLQAYRIAADRLVQRVAAAALEDGKAKPPAVILDLDETVFDNSAYQSYLLRGNKPFEESTWEKWEIDGVDDVKLVPGAGAFVQRAKRLNVAVFYITNRTEKNRAGTMAALKKNGIDVPDGQLLCSSPATGSDKTSRRRAVEAGHTVLLLVGDNLRDFDEQFKSAADAKKGAAEIAAAIGERREKVDAEAKKWGDLWIILPNPAYGEWAKVLGRGDRDLELMVPAAKVAP